MSGRCGTDRPCQRRCPAGRLAFRTCDVPAGTLCRNGGSRVHIGGNDHKKDKEERLKESQDRAIQPSKKHGAGRNGGRVFIAGITVSIVSQECI